MYERLKLLEDEYTLLQVYAHNLENLVHENGLQGSLNGLMETVSRALTCGNYRCDVVVHTGCYCYVLFLTVFTFTLRYSVRLNKRCLWQQRLRGSRWIVMQATGTTMTLKRACEQTKPAASFASS